MRASRRIDATYSRQRATEAVPVSSSRAVWTSLGNALAYASARLTSTRGQRKWLAVFSTDLVSSCTASTSHTATRWPVRYASRPESESRNEIPGNSVSTLFSMTYRATRSLFEVRAARACLLTSLSYRAGTRPDTYAALMSSSVCTLCTKVKVRARAVTGCNAVDGLDSRHVVFFELHASRFQCGDFPPTSVVFWRRQRTGGQCSCTPERGVPTALLASIQRW